MDPRTSPRTLSRRRLLQGSAITAAALAVGGVSGCSALPRTAGSQVEYWHLMSGGDGIRMGDMVAAINGRGPGFDVHQTVLAWGPPYYTKLAMAAVGGKAPDVAIMHHTRVPGYAPGGLIDPWDLDELAKLGVTKDKFPERVWDKGVVDGQLFSIALDSHPFIMLYNTDVADKAGVLASSGQLDEITSPEQLLEVGTKMAEVTGTHGYSYGYLGDGAQMWRMFYTFYRQQNAEWVLPQGGKSQVDIDAGIKALELMQQILNGTIASTSGDIGTGIAEFSTGGSGALFTGVWETPTVQTAGIPFDATTIPNVFGTPAAYADSHAFVLPHQPAPGQTRQDAYAFVADMLKDSFSWAEAGHIPAYQPVVDSDAYRSLLPQAHYAKAAEIINYDPTAYFTGSGSNFQIYFADTIQNVLLGRTTPAAGLQAFVARIDDLLSKPNPV